jgi:dolichol-phosphate mannosyltransferase
VPDSTDFRLIDRQVREQFSALSERNRMTRGLIDWLGYTQAYVPFVVAKRAGGHRSYSFRKLAKLAVDSVISLSTSPLYIAAYAGVAIMLLAVLLGGGMLVNVMTGDPLALDAEGGAYVLVLLLFLVGLMLTSQGIIGLYLSHIHAETQNRPLYVIEEESHT